jgi:DNA-binding NarL/FixJ family response regulator
MRAPRSARVADDHQALLALTAEALAGECLVVGRVGDGCELLTEAERLHPDVIVLDISMPRLDGIEAARQLQRSQGPARLVFLTVHEDADYARAALDAGGLGYVVKTRLASDLLPAILAALADSPNVQLDEARLAPADLTEKTTPIYKNHEADPHFIQNPQCHRPARPGCGLREHPEQGKLARCRGLHSIHSQDRSAATETQGPPAGQSDHGSEKREDLLRFPGYGAQPGVRRWPKTV